MDFGRLGEELACKVYQDLGFKILKRNFRTKFGELDLVCQKGQIMRGKKEVWDKPRPKGLGEPKPLTPAQKTKAKAIARKSGSKYPSLVANMQAARKK